MIGLLRGTPRTPAQKWVVFYLGLTALGECIAFTMVMSGMKNILFYNLFRPFTFALMMLVIDSLLEKRYRSISGGLFVIFISLFALDLVIGDPELQFLTYSTFIQKVTMLVLSLVFFWNVFNDSKIKELESHPHFWFGSGILLYTSGSFFVYMFNSYILRAKTDGSGFDFDYWMINQIFAILFYLFLTIGLWLRPSKQ